MSIWGGMADIGDFEDPKPVGTVLKNLENNWYPEPDRWPLATVDLGLMSPWCVPGHPEDENSGETGPWLRLGVYDGDDYASVVMDENAAKELARGVTEWLAIKKVHPSPVRPPERTSK